MKRGRGCVKAVALLLAAFVGLMVTACSTTIVEEHTFQVGAEPKLVVRNFNGRVNVIAGTPGQVTVRAEVRGTQRVAYSALHAGDTVTVEAKPQSAFFAIAPDVGVHLIIMAPPSTALDVETTNGLVRVEGFRKGAMLVTSNGRITVLDMKGELVAETKNGAITVDDFEGNARLKAVFGAVVLQEVRGAFDVETDSGAIVFAGELTPGGESRLHTTNGRVAVTLPGEPSVELDVLVSNGSITSELPLETTAAEPDQLTGVIGAGEAKLEVRTTNGLVTLE